MAIQKSITDVYGATHANSYTKIGYMVLSDTFVTIRVYIYHDAASRSKGDTSAEKARILDEQFNVSNISAFSDTALSADGVSPMKQAYAWLKTQTDINGLDYTTGTTDV